MWDRFLFAKLSTESDADFARRLLVCNNGYNGRLFVQQEGTEEEYSEYGLSRLDGRWEPASAGEMITEGVEKVLDATLRATTRWRKDFESMLPLLEYSENKLLQVLRGIDGNRERYETGMHSS